RRAPRGRAASGPPEGPPPKKLRKRLKWVAISVVGVLLLGAGGIYGYYEYLNSRLKTTPKNAGTDAPKAPADAFGRRPLNILLIGSDSRVGAGNEGYGDAGHEGLADTTILMHISADRSNATLVSIPRDTMVKVPKCTVKGKVWEPVNSFPFNETLTRGGPQCTVSTVDTMLGLQVDHYIMIDFKGVKEMTSAVGGVPVCLSAAINDPVLPNHGGGTDLFLKAGPQRLAGENALKFLRARHAFGDGSDLSRIEAQKGFLMSLAREVKGNASLTNVDGMFKIANTAVNNLTVDDGLGGIDKLIALGNEIKKVPEKRMAFTTLPNQPYPPNPKQRVEQAQPAAKQLWAAVAADSPLTEGDKDASPPAEAQPPAAPPPAVPTTPTAPDVDASKIQVYVTNGGGVNAKGKEVADVLKDKKFQVPVFRTAQAKVASSVVNYPVGQKNSALAVAAAVGLPATAIHETAQRANSLELVIGKDFPPGGTATAPSGPPAASAPPEPPSASTLKQQTADQTVCAPKKGS
ncbi:LCP family protein, partial [Streptomyces sp. SID3343]|uniref:LCP family protein n=1 Tax=Streptomyces sp. SID3343 TaxID=2690260 RepID=UPI00136E103E